MTTEDVQKIFVTLTEIKGELKLQNRVNADILEQAQKTNGRVTKLEDSVSTIKLERAEEKGRLRSFVSVISTGVSIVVGLTVAVFKDVVIK